jgi:Outer membrane protein beta-barrel domain
VFRLQLPTLALINHNLRQRRAIARASALLLALVPFTATSSTAQSAHRFNIAAGAGFSTPVQAAGANLDNGWNLTVRGGLNAGRHIDADLDYSYSHFGLNPAALAYFGQPGGSVGVWNLSFQPQWHLAPRRSRANAYATGGFGIFHRNLSLTQPAVATSIYCDPFFGCYPYSYPADQVVASFSTVKPGFNVGSGLEFRLGQSGAKLFAEARYQRMFTNHGSDFTYVPATFGFRW